LYKDDSNSIYSELNVKCIALSLANLALDIL
jgi:hypothetical protein